MVERHLAKVAVVGSSPIARSNFFVLAGEGGRAARRPLAKTGDEGGGAALAGLRRKLFLEGVVDFLQEGVGLGVGEGAFWGTKGVGKAFAAGEVLPSEKSKRSFFDFGGVALVRF